MARFKWAELKGGDGVLVRRTGSANFEDLSTQISQWLGNKGFDVRVLQVKPGGSLIQAREPTSLKTAIGASAPLEVELSPDSAGTLVDVRMGKVGGSVWMARFLTYSWVGLGVTFLPLKKELEEFVRKKLLTLASAGINDVEMMRTMVLAALLTWQPSTS